MDVSIIIINYNTFDLTCNCIKSVIEHTSGLSYEIILVDNASTECSADLFSKQFSDIVLVKNMENTGFSKGNNLGIPYAKGHMILLLNSDTVLKNNAVKITADYLQQHPSAGVVSARITYPGGTAQSVCQRFPSIRYQLFELCRLHKVLSKEKAGRILLGSFFNYKADVVADWVWGTYFMFRKELLNRLPGKKLNDDLFMYGEDQQWCFDIRQAGFGAHFCAGADVIHYLGGSAGNAQQMIEENHRLFMKKNYNFIHRLGINILHSMLHKK